MKIKTAIVVTCISAILLFAPINLSLVSTTNHFCIVVCQIPFTNRVLQLPYWTWTASLLLVPVCILAILLSGFSLWSDFGEKERPRKSRQFRR
jgi:hypothetical protein